jgi:hypothetical protein
VAAVAVAAEVHEDHPAEEASPDGGRHRDHAGEDEGPGDGREDRGCVAMLE